MATDSLSDIEEWRPVVGFDDYEVSSLGRIRRVGAHPYRSTPFIVKCQVTAGYPSTLLRRGGQRRRVLVHRAVAMAFIGDPPTPQHEAAHYDGNPLNAILSNLRWATPTENQLDKHRHGTMPVQRGEANYRAKLTAADVIEIKRLRHSGLLQREIAARFCVSRPLVNRILRGRCWQHMEAGDA